MNVLTEDMIEAAQVHSVARQALSEALASGADHTVALAALNAARIAAGNAGHPGYMNTNETTIVDGRPYSRSTVTTERAAQIMANASVANGRTNG